MKQFELWRLRNKRRNMKFKLLGLGGVGVIFNGGVSNY